MENESPKAPYMTNTKATPGPWQHSVLQPLYVVLTTCDVICSLAEFNQDGTVDLLFADSLEEAKANARLISSCPDMSEELLCIHKCISDGRYSPMWLDLRRDGIEAALRKAGLL